MEAAAAGPDKGRARFLEIAAMQVAVARGLGFRGVYLAGQRNAGEIDRVLATADAFAGDDWRSLATQVHFPRPGTFRLFADAPVTGPRLTVLFSGRDISKRLGSVKGYTIHGLRRTCATYLDEMGFPESTISLCLNHTPKREKRPDAGATVTRRYIKASASTTQRRAAASSGACPRSRGI